MEKKETSYNGGGNVNWCSHCEEQYEASLKKLKIELPYDPAIPLLGINLEKMNTNSKRYMHSNVHSSTIYNGQHVEAT